MNVLIDIGHPAHYHNYKNLIKYLIKSNHNIVVTIRNRDVISNLLLNDNIPFVNINDASTNLFGLFSELFSRTIKLYRIAKKNDIDVFFGSINVAWVSKLLNTKSYIFAEDDDDIIEFLVNFGYPFFTKIFNPDCIKFKKQRHKRVLYNSYHELAYLHPNNFEPKIDILNKYNLQEKKYIILRLNSHNAHHDVGAKGISNDLYLKINDLLKEYTIIESRENSKTHQIEPWDMHHVLAHAKMIISDSQTMTIEAAVLGIPAVRINTFIGKSTVIEELEQTKYKLAFGFYPHQEEESLKTIEYLVNDSGVDGIWQERRKKMLSEKCDLNQWMINYFEREINK